jgi:hypothetical protein
MPSRKDDGPDATAPCCTKPEGRPVAVVLEDGRIVLRYPSGRMGGEVWPFVDPNTGEVHWIECVVVTNAEGVPVLLIPVSFFLSFRHAGAYLGVRKSTLYSWVSYLESAEKRGARLIFRTLTLVNDDIPELENKLPSREDLLADRNARALEGEVLRVGRHIAGCLRAHSEGPCIRRPRPNDPHRTAKRILRTLGKKPKK